jgi:hypothetical protein
MTTDSLAPLPAGPAPTNVAVTDIHMPFVSMVIFMVKWAVASIPALIILMVAVMMSWGVLLAMFKTAF